MDDYFSVQVQPGAAFCEILSFLRGAIGTGVCRLEVLSVAAPLGFAFQALGLKLCLCDKSQLKLRFC